MQLLLIAAAILGLAGAAAAFLFLRRLRQTPPLTEADQRAGLTGMRVQVEGTPIFTRFSPQPPQISRPPVVLVHGMVISSRSMVPLAREIAKGFAVYAPDLPGFGESRSQGRMPSIEAMADAIYGWMQALWLARAHFIGSSFGCQVVAALAVRHHSAVEKAVLVGPTVDPAARGLLLQAWRLALNSRREPASEVGKLSRIDYAKAGLGRVIDVVRITLRDRIEERLPLMPQPTLVVRGSRDPIVPHNWAERASILLPNGRLEIIDGAAHDLHLSHPRALLSLLLPFFLAS